MNKKQFLKGVPEENKKFYEAQIDKELTNNSVHGLPYTSFVQGFKVKSLNALLTMHWRVSSNYKKACVKAMDNAFIPSVKLPEGRRLVILTRIIPPRGKTMDADNLRSGFKYILDQLTKRGWLVDDSPKWCEVDIIERRPEEHESWGVLIEIKEM